MSLQLQPPTASAEGMRATAQVRNETPIDLRTASTIFPRGNRWRSISISAVIRWIVGGKKGVKLEAIRIGSKWYTSVEAIHRFCEAVKAREKS